MTPLREREAWRTLERHHVEIARHLCQLFAEEPGRGERLVGEAAGLFVDYPKHRVTDETIAPPVALAEDCNLAEVPR